MEQYNVWIEVDIAKIKNNLAKVRTLVEPSVKVLAIVKANAYGHGMVPVAHALADSIDYFGVSSFAEGDALRRAGILTPILILGAVLPDEMRAALNKDLTFSISSMEYAEALNRLSAEYDTPVKVHIKVDTGMGRWGIPYRSAFEHIKKIVELPHVNTEGIFTHFPVADNEYFDYTERQIELFKTIVEELTKAGISFRHIHAANSAGILNFAESHFSLIRPGIMMYGYYPRQSLQEKLALEPVLAFKTRVNLIKEFPPQRGIGYGRTFITTKHTRIAVIPVGYSHGYPYALSQKARALIKGRSYPLAGTVSMDYCMLDVGDTTEVAVGDEVVLLGTSGEAAITAYELAEKANTIPYEIITNLNADIPHVYLNSEADESEET